MNRMLNRSWGKNLLLWAFFPLAAVAAEPRSEVLAAQPLEQMPELESFVEGVVTKIMSDRHIAGAQVSIVRNGEVVLLKGYGIDSLNPERKVDPKRSLFRIASVSKTFLWIALMQLQERGQLQLTDPINKYLPDTLKIADDGFTQSIRIIDLMNHTAGFEDNLQGLFQGDETSLLPLAEHLQRFRPRRVREPGQIMSYSNYASALAGAIVAHVSKMEYERYIEERILAPLQLTAISFREHYTFHAESGLPQPMAAEHVADQASALEWGNGVWNMPPNEYLVSMAPAGVASASAEAMARYMRALLDPSILEQAGILKATTYAEMRSPSFQFIPGMNTIHHGFFNGSLGLRSRVNVDNFSQTGSTLHFFSVMVLIPDLGVSPSYLSQVADSEKVDSKSGSLGIFVTTNSSGGRALVEALPEAILAKYFPTKNSAASPAPVAELQAYAGTYRNLRRSFTQLEKLKSVVDTITFVATSDGYLQANAGTNPPKFERMAQDVFRQIDGDSMLAFVRDESGRVTQLSAMFGAYQASFDRIGFFQSARWFVLSVFAAIVTSIVVPIAALVRRRRAIAQSQWERRSAAIATIAAGLWILFAVVFAVLVAQFQGIDAEDRFFHSYPATTLKVMLAVILFASALSIAAVPATVVGWRDGQWTTWRRLRHAFVLTIFVALIATLASFNALGFRYF